MRIGIACMLAIIVLGAPVAQADYLQWGVDAARTGVTTELGPVRDDVAFVVDLPGERPWWGHPVIIDDTVFVPVHSADELGREMNAVVRVDLETADMVPVVTWEDERPLAMVSDGESLFVVFDLRVTAYDLEGEFQWEVVREPQVVAPLAATWCVPPAVTADSIFLYCADLGGGTSVDASNPVIGVVPFVAAEMARFVWAISTNTANAEHRWIRTEDPLDGASPEPTGVNPPRAGYYELGGISVVAGLVVTTSQQSNLGGLGDVHVRALDESDGGLRWINTVPMTQETLPTSVGPDGPMVNTGYGMNRFPGPVTGSDEAIYFALTRIMQIDPGDGGVRYLSELPLSQDPLGPPGGTTLAISGDSLFSAAGEGIGRFDHIREELMQHRFNPYGDYFVNNPPILADGVLYGMTQGRGIQEEGSLYAWSPVDLTPQWDHHLVNDDRYQGPQRFSSWSYGVASGVITAVSLGGQLHVLGTTAASLTPQAVPSTLYPGVGEEVRVDLSGTLPGAFGEPTDFRAVWGDAIGTEWQDEPSFVHTFRSEGEHAARFMARNDAGQIASTTLTFHVGEDPPTELNLLQKLFAPDNQNMTFGLLGILVAISGGVFGVTRQHRKRTRLQHELEALERGFDDAKENPSECEAFLDTRKARARSLMLDGALTEDQFHVLEKRVDELHRDLRTTLIDARFDFLPHGMVESIKKALADGHINVWEREALDGLLEREKGLTKRQKEIVRKQLDEWLFSEPREDRS